MLGKIWKWLGDLSLLAWLWGGLSVFGSVALSIWAWLSGLTPVFIALIGIWALVGLLVIAILVHYIAERFPMKQKAPDATGWKEWLADKRLKKEIKSLATEHTRIDLEYYDGQLRPFYERLAETFQMAGWDTHYYKAPRSQGSPFYKGIHVEGPLRTLVESVATALSKSGLHGVKSNLTPHQIPPENPKYPFAQQRIRVIVGYEN